MRKIRNSLHLQFKLHKFGLANRGASSGASINDDR